jgi:extracellular elastinolytic metalloproteinase
MKKNKLLVVLLLAANALYAQKTMDAEAIARQHLSQNAKTWQLTDADISDVGIQQSYTTDDNGLTHVYLTQQRNGIEVYNAIVNVNVTKEGTVIYAGNRFVANLKVNASQPAITAGSAIAIIAQSLGMSVAKEPTPLSIDAKKRVTFAPNGLAHQEMHAQLRYQPIGNDGQARLAWDVDMDAVNGNDHWTMRVDALTGQILDKKSWTVHCQFGDEHDHQALGHNLTDGTSKPSLANFNPQLMDNQVGSQSFNSSFITHHSSLNTPLSNFSFFDQKSERFNVGEVLNLADVARKTAVESLLLDDGKYRALVLPVESPLHGSFSLTQNVIDSVASPYGWHDTTGTVGADTRITRGNNVHAFLDLKNYNRSVGDEPNGGPTLTFDYPYDALQTQSANVKNLATTNLFYMNNVMHDFTYRYGFDEVSGNFQYNNYGRGGLGRDFVNANAQDGSSLPDPALNNANMSSPPDGFNGRMQMYLWARRGTRMLNINAPNSVAGSYATGTAQFGRRISTVPLSGDIVVFNDGNTNATEACSRSLANLTGKIALIDRGNTLSSLCSYGKKVLNAQDSGAVACIICSPSTALPNGINDTLTTVNINGVDRPLSSVTIPVVTLTSTDCARLKAATAGLNGTIQRMAIDTIGPDFIDGDFDNGIIAHEFGHGISTRLTGGPLNSSCLNSGEQMGEGWSDFMGLVLTAKTGDNGAMKRGIGNFALRLPIDGNGIRRFPYSTDMTINPHTYDNLFVPNGQVSPHPIGEIWCTTLWDMYWKFTDKYGFDQNPYNTKSGNGKAIKLVFDGMKIQPCSPGMLDGRDAIIAADQVNNNGDNVCMIWEAFARRGMGFSASQGKGTSASDNVEAFDMPPSCIKTVKVIKNMTPSVSAGQSVEVRLRIYNNRDTSASVTLVDTIPQNATYVASSSNRTATLSGVNLLNFATFSVQPRDSAIVVYRIRTDPTKKSTLQFYDDMETTSSNWTATTTGTGGWAISDAYVKTGLGSFFADGLQVSTEKTLRLATPRAVSGQQPMLRFFHRFDTEGGFDAGVVEISATNGVVWENAAPYTFRNPAFGRTYGTFAFADKTYWGNSTDFVPSYLDLSNFAGRNITIRYRLRTDASTNSVGWAIDDVLMMDAVNYNAGVRMVATSGTTYRDTVRTVATQRGTIIEPETRVSNTEINKLNVRVYPNPSQSVVNVVFDTPSVASSLAMTTAKATVLAIDGRVLLSQNVLGNAQINVSSLAAGLYFIKIETDKGVFQQKIVKQ